ncbi:MAG: carboxypeptidase-like regulatory domain-containing protein [Rubricoccaceae bacterium]|nr:carboxypeptidase-like regulatory domain-containing protein [Rubricoccaceae bacterium]
MRLLSLASSVAVLTLAVLLAGCDAAAPSTSVSLRLEGTVRDAATGAAVPGAEVLLYVVNEDLSTTTLARTTADSDGRFTLSHRLEDVATEGELGGACAIWNDGVTAEVSLAASAEGYADGRFFSAEPVACTDAAQTVALTLTRF